MRYKSFGKTGLKLSAIGAGTWGMGGRGWGASDKAGSISALHAMLDLGVNHIDTAPAYGRGLAEEIIGEAIDGIRGELIVTTKCGMNIDKPGMAVKTATWDEVIKGCEGSLTRMKLDYIDILLLHWPDVNTPLQETMEAMSHLKKQGKIRFVGVSNLSADQMEEASKYADVAVTQLPYSMVDRSAETDINWAHRNGIATMTYGSLGAGILAGGIRKYTEFGEGDVRGGFYSFFREPMFSKIMALLESMDTVAENRGVPVAQVAVNWAVQKEYVHTALIGVRTAEHAKDNCRAMEWELTGDEIMFLDEKISNLLG